MESYYGADYNLRVIHEHQHLTLVLTTFCDSWAV